MPRPLVARPIEWIAASYATNYRSASAAVIAASPSMSYENV